LIQLAVGFHHLMNGNLKGTESQLDRGLVKLREYPDLYAGVALDKLCEEVDIWIEKVRSRRPASVKIEDLPKIRLVPMVNDR
jgi:hypothetical protein